MPKIWGIDVSKNFIVAFDGEYVYKISNENLHLLKDLFKPNDVAVMEQTGAYGVRYAEILTSLGCKVFFADGKEFKAYRHGNIRKKSDTLDAKYLRQFFSDLKKRKHCYEYNPRMVYTRALVRQHIRNKKDLIMHMNRLKQYLAVIFPEKEYYDLPKNKFLKTLDQIEIELYNSIHPFTDLALSELRKLREAYNALKRIEKELKSIAQNHPDYEILKTFPHLSDITIATLIAYYWDINRFNDVDAFIGYTLMGVKYEQSGKWESQKTDKARTEIKGNFYMVFMQAHKQNSPLRPLTELVNTLSSGRGNYKRRYIKFLDFLFRLIYIALKERTDFKTALKRRIYNIETDLKYKQLKNKYSYELVNIQRSLNVHFEILKLAECQDISSQKQGGSVKFMSASDKNIKEEKNEPEQTGLSERNIQQTQERISSFNTQNDGRNTEGIPPFIRRKGIDTGEHSSTPPIRNTDEEDQTGEEIPF